MFSQLLYNFTKQSCESISHPPSHLLKLFCSQSAARCGPKNVGKAELSSLSLNLAYHRLFHSSLSKRLLYEKTSMVTLPLDVSGHLSCHNFHHRTCLKREITDGKNRTMKYSTVVEDKPGKGASSLLETWFYEVSPYGSIVAHLPFKTIIQPLNPIDYPDMNKCIVELRYNAEENLPNSHQLAQVSNMYNLNVSFDKDKANMTLNCDVIEGVSVPVSCHIRVPLKFDLSVKVSGNENIVVENMESNSINIESEKGNVTLKKIKSGSVSVANKSGDITSKSTLLGNVSLHCGNSGNISADKLQGSSMTCITEMGSIDIKSLYSEGATFKTVLGDVRLGQGHGQICVVGERSNLHIESLDGDLDVGIQHGSIKAHLSRHTKVDIDVNKGDIGLSFPEGVSTDLLLRCPSVSVEKNLDVNFKNTDLPHHKEGFIGEKGVAQVNARTLSGNIHLSVLDWIQTTKLLFMDKQALDEET